LKWQQGTSPVKWAANRFHPFNGWNGKKNSSFFIFEKKSKGTFVGLKILRQFFEISRLDATILIWNISKGAKNFKLKFF
jgi:hypothetical protein